ncbi:ABC transporter ATP-binding protein [Gemella cuniculi]|uniref:ATP-binding cassette domain-containing protein n=1 Tax=Gemella cuniculi TaxID=150240 RepID=UPI0003F7A6D6|nr:ABC transporter ATP-binding protein [Gemella cuniculi]
MRFKNFSLKIGNKKLFDNVNINFGCGISHLIGRNGSGKSCLVKSLEKRFDYSGEVFATDFVIIASYSNIPSDLKWKDLERMLNKDEYFSEKLKNTLNIENINRNIQISKLSDGQKQKLKLLFYLVKKPKIIIFDEFTNGLDKQTTLELYKFINNYINEFKDVVCLNITHNMADLSELEGKYYLIENNNIKEYKNKELVIEKYIKGDI